MSSVPAATASCNAQALSPACVSEPEDKLIACPSTTGTHSGASALSCQADCAPCLTAGGSGMERQSRSGGIALRAGPMQGLFISLDKKPPRNLL
jgi:hypothetical protein